MRVMVHRAALTLVMMGGLTAGSASAQVFGTFAWQMQPYCNVVTLTITQFPGGYTVDGNDSQCGSGTLAGATGQVHINPNGTVGVNFAIITTPAGKAVHVAAVLSPANGSGTWTDSVGHSGAFALGANVPGLPRLPVPASGLGVAVITGVEVAAGAIGGTQINTTQVQARVSGTCPSGEVMTGVNQDGTVVCAAIGAVASQTFVHSVIGAADATASTLTFTAPFTGTALVRARGFCNMFRQAAVENQVDLAILLPGETVNGVIGAYERVATVRLPALSSPEASQWALGFTAERDIAVTQGVAYVVDLAARRFSSADTSSCRGTFGLTLLPTLLP